MRRAVLSVAILALWLGSTTEARAGFGVGGSVGTGFFVKDGSATRTPINIEVLPFFKVGPLYADLGITFDFDRGNNLGFRPGLRLDLSVLYGRFAVPLRVTGGFDYGFLVGLGHIFGIGPAGLFIEADAAFSNERGLSAVGAEFRAGVQFAF